MENDKRIPSNRLRPIEYYELVPITKSGFKLACERRDLNPDKFNAMLVTKGKGAKKFNFKHEDKQLTEEEFSNLYDKDFDEYYYESRCVTRFNFIRYCSSKNFNINNFEEVFHHINNHRQYMFNYIPKR